MPPIIATNPIVVAIVAVLTEAGALVVGFGILDGRTAGLAVSLGTGIVVLGATIYFAAHAHASAVVKAAQIRAQTPPAPPVG